MIRVVRMVLIGAVAWASTPGGAWADPAPVTDKIDKKQVAKRYVDAGAAAKEAGDYDTAIAMYQKAYQLVPHPKVIFDIAQALRLAGRLDEALREYRRYVAAEPSGEEAETAREFIAELEAKIEAKPASNAQAAHDTPGTGDSQRTDGSLPDPHGASNAGPPPAPPAVVPEAAPAERPAPPQATSNRVALGLGGGALVLLGAAAGVDHWAWSTYHDARHEMTSHREALYSSANTRYHVAQGLAAAGIGCAAAAVWLYLGRRDSTVATSAMRHELVVSPTGIAVTSSF